MFVGGGRNPGVSPRHIAGRGDARRLWDSSRPAPAGCGKADFALHRRACLPWRSAAHDRPGHCRSEEHTSELQSLMRISYAVFCVKKKNKIIKNKNESHMQNY